MLWTTGWLGDTVSSTSCSRYLRSNLKGAWNGFVPSLASMLSRSRHIRLRQTNISSSKETRLHAGRRMFRLRPVSLHPNAIVLLQKESDHDEILYAEYHQRPEPGHRHGHGTPSSNLMFPIEAGVDLAGG